MMFRKSIQTRLAVRSAVTILILLVLAGLVSLVVSIAIVWVGENSRQQRQLQDLLDTVERTAQIATFLADTELALEVVEGLAGNSIVQAVALHAEGERLAESIAYGQTHACTGAMDTVGATRSAGQAILRPIYSPFDSGEVVGELLLCPNYGEIRTVVAQSALYAGAMLLLQIVLIGAGVAWVVIRLVTRPITQISHHLHSLKVENGEKLELPDRNAHDEIGQLVTDVNGMIDRLVLTIEQERMLRQEREVGERRFRAIFDNAATAIFLFDRTGQMRSFNPEFLRNFQLDPDLGQTGATLNLYQMLEGQASALRRLAQRCLNNGESVSAELEVGRAPQTTWLQVTLSLLDEGLIQGVANDITRRRLAHEEAEQRAVTDSLTGVGNRAGFEHRLAQLTHHRQHAERFALLFVDLDHFKAVNDTHGHQVGDRILQTVAQRLRDVSRKADYVARLGGDEFVLLLVDADRDAAVRVASEAVSTMAHPQMLRNGLALPVSLSVGVALSAPDETAADLVRRADKALYQAKARGRNQYCIAP